MEIRIMGPLEVREGERVIEVGGGKQRALLADLVIHRARPLTPDQLIEDLWGGQAPASAAKTLQVLISRLRKTLTRDAIVMRGGGYALAEDLVTTDVDEFDRRLRRSREADDRATAVEALRSALALVRGPPLADFMYEDFAQSEIARLEELRLHALEDRLEADLADGSHAGVVAELEALVSEHPLRERLRAQLMLALYRAGRQADALEAYRAAREKLLDELGIEPGRPLRELHQAILQQHPSLEVKAAAPVVPEPGRSTFVGRERELRELITALENASAGRGGVYLVAGEPGIGKSRLAEELVAHARARGVRILVGRCWEAGGAPAYWPWVQSLRGYIQAVDAAALPAQIGAAATELSQILPELCELFPGLPEPSPGTPESARFRLFTATRDFLANASREQPILLVLDDLHAADAPSLLLLQFLAREVAAARLLIVGAYRDVDPVPGQPLTELLVELTREPTTGRISLSGLTERDVAKYVERAAADIASPDLVGSLFAETEGNPLFVSETVRLLALERARNPSAATTLAIPQSVRDVILRRLRHLSEECNGVLAVASVLGRDFRLDTLARASGVEVDALLDILDDAMNTRVISEVTGSPQHLRFAHVLIRDTLYEDLSAARRVRLHRLVVQALEAIYSEATGPHLAELAHHSIAGSDFERALEYARRGGDHALSQLAYEEAARLYHVALDALDLIAATDARARLALLLSLGEAELRAGDAEAAKRAFLGASEIADALDLPREFARAAVGYGGRIVWARAGDDERLVPLLEAALERLPEDELELRSRLLARLSGALRDQPVPERRKEMSAAAVELARRSGDPLTLAVALDSRVVSLVPVALLELLHHSNELLEVSRSADPERAIHAHSDLAYAYLQLGDADAARESLREATRRAEELRQPTQLWLAYANAATVALAEGRFSEGRELADAAHAIGVRAQPDDAIAVHALQRYTLFSFVGGVGDIETTIQDVAMAYPARPVFRCVLAHLSAERRDLERAGAIFAELAVNGFESVPVDPDWLCAMSLLAETAVALEDRTAAQTVQRLLRPYADRNVSNVPEPILGAAARYVALVAAAAGDAHEAETMYEAAIAMNQRMGFRPWLAHTQRDYGRFLYGRDGETPQSRQLLDAALATYRALGMDAHAKRICDLDRPLADPQAV